MLEICSTEQQGISHEKRTHMLMFKSHCFAFPFVSLKKKKLLERKCNGLFFLSNIYTKNEQKRQIVLT